MRKSYFRLSLIVTMFICIMLSSSFAISGEPNNPLIDGNMVPVKWDGANWYATDEFDIAWYNYNEDRWANVMLKDGLSIDGISDVNTATLDEMKDKRVITAGSMFVWIPRYTYKIEDNLIDISWSNGINDNISNDFKRSPAFFYGEYLGGDETDDGLNKNENFTNRNGTANELTGIWVAKFAAGNDNGKVTILPEYSFYKGTFNNLFNLAKELNGGDNSTSHMMKTSEWAAVAYLSQALGKSTYINNSDETGFGGYSESATASSTSYRWNTDNGKFASTTNNVYGVYDLSGGTWEYVAGVVGSRDIFNLIASGTDNYKDVDIIKSVSNYGGLALLDTKGLNGDNSTNLTNGDIIIRGGDNSLASKAGTFAYSVAAGSESYGFRPVIVILPSEDSGSLSLIESEATVIEGGYTTVNIHFSSSFTWDVSDLKTNLLDRADIRVQYTSDDEIVSISDINSRIISIENLDTKKIVTSSSSLPSGNYLMKVEVGGDDLAGNPVFSVVENSECKIIINSLVLIDSSDNEVLLSGIDLNKVRVSVYDGSGVIPDIIGIEINPVPDRVNYPYKDSEHTDLELTGGRINIITPGRNVTKTLKEEDIKGLVQRDESGNIIKVVVNDESLLDKIGDELKEEISGIEPIISDNVVDEFNNDTLGSWEVIVEYSGYTDTFIVNITDDFYTLTVVASPEEAVTAISKGGKYEKGDTISISFNRSAGYKFVGWQLSDSDATIGDADSASTYVVMGGKDLTVTAKFKQVKRIEVTGLPDKVEYAKGSRLDLAGGEITIYYDDNSTDTKSLTSNDVITDPYNGYLLNDVTLDKVVVTYEGVTDEFSIKVKESFTLTLKVKYPKIGTVSGAGLKEEGSQFQIRAGIYEQYYSIYKYTGCVCTDSDTGEEIILVSEKEGMTDEQVYLELLPTENRTYPAELLMPARNITIVFNFEEPVKVTYNTDGNGAVRYEDSEELYVSIVQEIVNGGTTVPVVAEPFDGYRFVKWSDEKTDATRTDENVVENATYTAQFETAYWNLVYKNCNGDIIATQENVVDKSEVTNIPVCPLESHTTLKWIDEVTGEEINFARIERDGVIPNGDEFVIRLECDRPDIIFTPDSNTTLANFVKTKVTGINIDDTTLEYIINENNTEVINGTWDYASGDFFELEDAASNGWYVDNTTINDYTGNVYRSANNLSVYTDSNTKIIINTPRIYEEISFEYMVSASDDSAFGVTMNGREVLQRTGSFDGWRTYTGRAGSVDGKIIIGLTYAKGASASGEDLVAIRNLKVNRDWTQITSGTTLQLLPVINGNNYIFARAYDNTSARNLITAVSGEFNGINLIGDVNLDMLLDDNDYSTLSSIVGIDTSNLLSDLVIKADMDFSGKIDNNDLLELEKILGKQSYYLVSTVNGTDESIAIKKPGITVTLTAVEKVEGAFQGWIVEGISDYTVSDKDITFVMPENNVLIEATFEYKQYYTLTTYLNGTVKESFRVQEGDSVTVNAREVQNREFSNWVAEGIDVDTTSKTLSFIMPANDVTLTAQFGKPTYILTVYTDGAIEEKFEVYEDEIITLTAIDSDERSFVEWLSDDAAIASTDKTIIFTMPAKDLIIRAVFE